MKSDNDEKRSALVTRRSQLLELMNQQQNRIRQTWDDEAKQSIREMLEFMRKQLEIIDTRLAQMIPNDKENARIIEILDSVAGVGPVMISTILAQLPELGKLSRSSFTCPVSLPARILPTF